MLSLWIAFATTLNHSLRWLMLPAGGRGTGRRAGRTAGLSRRRETRRADARHARVTLPLIAVLWTLAMVAFSMIVLRAGALPTRARLPA